MESRVPFLRAIILVALMAGVCQIAFAQKLIQQQKVTAPLRTLTHKEWLTPLPTAPAIPFRPFTLRELQTKMPGLKATDMVTLKNPKTSKTTGQIRASALVDSLNKYEQSLNKLGYSLRNSAALTKIPRKLNVNTQLIETRKNTFQSKLKTNVPPPAFLSMTNSQRMIEVRAARAVYAQNVAIMKPNIIPDHSLPSTTLVGGNTAACLLGDMGTFGVQLVANTLQNASYFEVSVENTSRLDVYILGQSINLVLVSAKLSSTNSNSSTYTPSGEILGIQIPGSAEQLNDVKNDIHQVPFDPPALSWDIPIVDGIEAILSVKVGAGVFVQLFADPRPMYADVNIQTAANVSVTVGLGVTLGGVVGIELQGQLQFFNGGIGVVGSAGEEVRTTGSASQQEVGTRHIQGRLSVSDYCNTSGSALSGDLSLYWWIGVCPWFCADGTIDLISWSGIDLSGQQFSDFKSTDWQEIGVSRPGDRAKEARIVLRDSLLWSGQGSWQKIMKPTF
jgi:hypothetical protein